MYEVDDMYGCHLWVGPMDGQYGRDGRQWAHRAAWERVCGPILPGTELDHLCRRTRCVRVSHLEAVPGRVNKRRMQWRHRASPRACSRGHDFFTNCKRTPEGGYVCRLCDR